MDVAEEEIQVKVEHPVGTKFRCPECQKELACYDHASNQCGVIPFVHAEVFFTPEFIPLARVRASESVDRSKRISCTFAPPTAKPVGIPDASVSNDRLVPVFPRSVGFFPVDSPPYGALVMAPSTLCQRQSSPTHSSYRSRAISNRSANTPRFTHSWK